jgi:hypothetical protein
MYAPFFISVHIFRALATFIGYTINYMRMTDVMKNCPTFQILFNTILITDLHEGPTCFLAAIWTTTS